MPLRPRNPLFQKRGVGGLGKQLWVMVAFQQQGVAMLQGLHHMGAAMAKVGQDAQMLLTIGTPQLQGFTGIMRHCKRCDLQAAYVKHLAVKGHLALRWR